MPIIYLSPSTQENNLYVNGGTEEEWMNKLADALERSGELELMEAALSMEGKREELSALLDALWTELGSRAVRSGDRRRLLRAAELVKQLRGAARLNVSAGQLSGWLCAGMFEAT